MGGRPIDRALSPGHWRADCSPFAVELLCFSRVGGPKPLALGAPASWRDIQAQETAGRTKKGPCALGWTWGLPLTVHLSKATFPEQRLLSMQMAPSNPFPLCGYLFLTLCRNIFLIRRVDSASFERQRTLCGETERSQPRGSAWSQQVLSRRFLVISPQNQGAELDDLQAPACCSGLLRRELR